MSHLKLVRIWDRDYNLRGQQFVPWKQGTFTIPLQDPMAEELWNNRTTQHQITVEQTSELAWYIHQIDLRKDHTIQVTCKPHIDILREKLATDTYLTELWLTAEKHWKQQQQQLPHERTEPASETIAAIIRDHTNPLGYECACGWQDQGGVNPDHSEHLADRIVSQLGLQRQDRNFNTYGQPPVTMHRYQTNWRVTDTGTAVANPYC